MLYQEHYPIENILLGVQFQKDRQYFRLALARHTRVILIKITGTLKLKFFVCENLQKPF